MHQFLPSNVLQQSSRNLMVPKVHKDFIRFDFLEFFLSILEEDGESISYK